MLPKVSIIWLNYNSWSNIDIVKSSLESCLNLDYPNYEVIVVDNGSTDGSFETIKEIAEKKDNCKVIRLEENLGFCGGNNAGYRARDPDSKYLVLLNNDCIPTEDSLLELVRFMERRKEDVASSQGIILNYNENKIDNAGFFISEFILPHGFLSQEDINLIKKLKKPFYISYASGCYCVYRISSLRRIMGDKLFYDEFHSYFDDIFLGLKFWSEGFKVVCLPKIVGKHFGSMSFRRVKDFQEYLALRGYGALFYLTNTFYNKFLLRNLVYAIKLISGGYKIDPKKARIRIKAIRDGVRMAKTLRKNGEFINIKMTPKIKYSIKDFISGILLSFKNSVDEEFRKIGTRWILERIDNFYI
jgi:GT2 family glycosyltransferase